MQMLPLCKYKLSVLQINSRTWFTSTFVLVARHSEPKTGWWAWRNEKVTFLLITMHLGSNFFPPAKTFLSRIRHCVRIVGWYWSDVGGRSSKQSGFCRCGACNCWLMQFNFITNWISTGVARVFRKMQLELSLLRRDGLGFNECNRSSRGTQAARKTISRGASQSGQCNELQQ